MVTIKLLDSSFNHAITTCDIQKSNFLIWDRNVNKDESLVVFTDNLIIHNKYYNSKKIALLIEPKVINSNIYNWILTNYIDFDVILTHNKYILDNIPNAVFYPHGGCWIYPTDQNIHEKNKNLSIILSNKKDTEGQKLRHDVVKFMSNIKYNYDSYGRGHNSIENKISALKDYRFSIVIENSKEDFYFSEKIIDCFRTGTIPIYYGCPSISDFFDIRGILTFDSLQELEVILNKLDGELYHSMIEYVHINFNLSENYLLIENWIYENTKLFK